MSEAKLENEVERIVLDTLADFYQFGDHKITTASNFITDLGFDDFDSLQFAYDIEEEFGIDVFDEEMAALLTVADAIALIEKKIGGAA